MTFTEKEIRELANRPVQDVKAAIADRAKDIVNGARRIYLSGPMKGYPQSNYPLFTFVAAQLRAAGHTVYNPSEFAHDGPHETFPLRKAFAEYAKFICEEADTIVLLPGWEASLGVSAELALAKNCRLEVVEFKDLKISFD